MEIWWIVPISSSHLGIKGNLGLIIIFNKKGEMKVKNSTKVESLHFTFWIAPPPLVPAHNELLN